jgi:phosphoglucosamine mutase
MRELKISTSWVRGVVGDALTPELVVHFAAAFGTWADGEPVVIGRDTRRSSTMLRAAVCAGLMSPGCEVIDLGVCPTPLVSFAVRELGCAGGISITGSHNDSEWNALKFVGPDGALLNALRGEELLDIYHASAFTAAPQDRLVPIAEAPQIQDRYLEHLLASLNADQIRQRKFTVAMDFCNGACADLAEKLLQELNCRLLPIHAQPREVFAHPPAPTPANMSILISEVRRTRVDLGAAVNIDGDRIAFVTGEGFPLSEEYTLPLAALGRLARRPGPVVTNLSTSRMVESVARDHGQKVIRTFVGESFVMDRGFAEGAVLAGEGSGGVGALPATTTFDALQTLGMILETLARTDSSLTSLAGKLPHLAMRKGEVPCEPDQAHRALETLRIAYQNRSPDCTDGVRVEWEDAWMHARVSNTEPLLRVIVEAEGEERADCLFEEAMIFARRAPTKEKGAK